ncbi:integumentary mucin C.1-like isoform X3 [Nerophis ophidion]|uniref:integumentary mucin C.1-like isoform X3 n=1 Tax=Nerophis ophidion TaxID=159077 RepID=UPI002ADF3672|nr:integumentary mucin C.1-like isoform X3 [Nerophis ophidion]
MEKATKFVLSVFLVVMTTSCTQALTQVVMPLMSDTMNISQPSNDTTTTTTPSKVSSTRVPVILPGTNTTTTPSQVSRTRTPVILPGTTTTGSTTTNNGQSQPSFSTRLFVVLFALQAI